MKTTKNPRFRLCRVCGSRLDPRIETRGRHWNCELAGWQIARDESDTRVVGDRHLVSTGVRWARCGCGSWTLTALSEGLAVAIDPAIVDEVAELQAVISGRRSFDLIRVSGRTELMYRDEVRQRTRYFPVCVEHPCGRPVSVDDPLERVKEKLRAGKKADAADKQLRRPAPLSETVAAQPPPF